MTYQRRTTGDGFDTLYSAEVGQTFHSIHGALTEAIHVFLRGAAIDQRLAGGLPSRVLEVGFGTGLNFWVTAQASRAAGVPLRYVALERELLPAELLAQLNHDRFLGAAADIRRAFLKWRAGLPEIGPPARLHREFEGGVRLELVLGDATSVQIPAAGYHAIYHDPFSPDANPELWTQAFLARLYALLSPEGRLATYSARGAVRRNLLAVGFKVQKQAGPPGKREMLVAFR